MLIEGSSGSSGGLVGEHQPDEPMRDGGRRAGRNCVAASEADWSKRIREMQYADYEDHTVGS